LGAGGLEQSREVISQLSTGMVVNPRSRCGGSPTVFSNFPIAVLVRIAPNLLPINDFRRTAFFLARRA
jgi:hypothetical protein